MSFSVDDLLFRKVYRYRDVDFLALEQRYGGEFLQWLYFHLMSLEAIPLASFRPERLDLGRYARFYTPRLEELLRIIFQKAGAQWRYENDLPDYHGPEIEHSGATQRPGPAAIQPGAIEALCFSGGGKDSLVAMKLLEEAGVSFGVHSYLDPVYGEIDMQRRLIRPVLDATAARRRHELEIDGKLSSLGSQGREARFGIESLVCAETPISLFGALPVALQHGYHYLVLGHERSAEEPNLVWQRTGETVNHQWGKTFEAERLVERYIREEMVSNVACFSILRPVYDTVIFNMLRGYGDAASSTHPCNVSKPWCGRCAKCAYVGLGFGAYLPEAFVQNRALADLFDAPENLAWFRELLGMGAHKPFECVGEIDEVRIAFEICRRKGYRGAAIEMYSEHAACEDLDRLASKYLNADADLECIPAEVRGRVLPLLRRAADEARQYISSIQ